MTHTLSNKQQRRCSVSANKLLKRKGVYKTGDILPARQLVFYVHKYIIARSHCPHFSVRCFFTSTTYIYKT